MLSIMELFDVGLDLYGLWLLREKRDKYKHLEGQSSQGSPQEQPKNQHPGDLSDISREVSTARESSNVVRAPPKGGRRGRKRKGGRAKMMMMSARGNNKNAISDANLLYPPIVTASDMNLGANESNRKGSTSDRDLALLLAA